MTYSFDEAITELGKITSNPSYSKEDLFDLAKQVEVTAEGNVTVLYSCFLFL